MNSTIYYNTVVLNKILVFIIKINSKKNTFISTCIRKEN